MFPKNRTWRKIPFFPVLFLALFIALFSGRGEINSERVPEKVKTGYLSIQAAHSRAYLSFLAADELEGRDTPSRGQTIARRYIESLYKTWGIIPAGDAQELNRSYEQRVPMIIKHFGEGTSLEIITASSTQKFMAEKDFSYVMGVDFAGTISGPVVFCGYGISAPDLGYDDFASVDLRNKIVLVAGGKPGGQRPDTPFNSPKHWARFEGRRTPAENCARLLARKGAAALLVVDESFDHYVSPHGYIRDARISSSSNRIFSPPLSVADPMVPTFWVSPRIAEALFLKVSKNFSQTVGKIDNELKPNSFALTGLEINIKIDLKQTVSACGNLLGMIEGSDPELKNEYIVIGAHLDHIGMTKDGYVFNGADDNGSGSVGVLQIARAMALNPEKPRRSIIFAHWTGEEKGLVGSRYFLKFPTIPVKNVAAYINLDMISHDCSLDEVKKEAKMFHLPEDEIAHISGQPGKLLRAYISAPSPELATKISQLNADFIGLDVVPLLSFPMLGNSDHYFFAFERVPSVFFFTGGNEYAHTPLDTVERINAEKMAAVIRLAYLLAFSLGDEPNRLSWKQ